MKQFTNNKLSTDQYRQEKLAAKRKKKGKKKK